MSQRRKPTYRKSSASVASSSQPTGRSNSGIQEQRNDEESFRRTTFSQVSKRIETSQSHGRRNVAKETVTDEELMEISAPSKSQIRFESDESNLIDRPEGHFSRFFSRNSPMNLTVHQSQQLKMITKYTSAQHSTNTSDQRVLSPAANVVTSPTGNEAVVRRKNKRSLSPLRESDPEHDESKRAKSTHRIEEAQQEPANGNNDDDEEISDLLDQRRARRMSLNQSQKANQTPKPNGASSGSCTTRKPTVRRMMSNQRYSAGSSSISFSQPTPSPVLNNPDVLEIVLDDDSDDEPRAKIPMSPNRTNHPPIPVPDHSSTSLSSTPVKPSLDSLILHKTHPVSFSTPIGQSTARDNRRSSFNVSSKINAITPNDSSPEKSERGNRRCSSISSSSLIYDTPSSSLSRTTTTISQTTPLSSPIRRSDVTTGTNDPLVKEMIVALIEQCGLNQNNGQDKIDDDPKELASELFRQSSIIISDRTSSTAKPQNLRFGKFEMEVVFQTEKQIPTIYVCDLCFKHFHGSAIASQRHAAKCLLTRPPGELVLAENDLAIFQIGEEKMTTEQRLYIESLHRVARLFDALDLNEVPHYILCRRDPVLSPLQPYIYRFIGYFARSFDPSASKPVDNFSCLFILPPYAHHPEYNQLLITYSYFLLRSQRPHESNFSSPERPLNRTSLDACLKYWCNTVLDHLFQRIDATISLETLARETFLHPRDILFSLYFNRFIRSHPTDSSMIYLLKSAEDHLKTNPRPRKRNFAFRTTHLPETKRNK